MSPLSPDCQALRMDCKNLVWMDLPLTRLQIIAQWLTLDADAVDSVGDAASAGGDGDVGVVVVERTRRKNGTKILSNPCHPRILICGTKGLPSQNSAVS